MRNKDKGIVKVKDEVISVLKQWRTEGGDFGGSTPLPPKFRSFDKVEPECKLSAKCLLFQFQHNN